MLDEFSLDHIYPEFEKIVEKAIEFSGNIMLFLPKNTSTDEIIERLMPYYKSFIFNKQQHEVGKESTDEDMDRMIKKNEFVIEIE